jgi:hypothetical protein
MPFGVGGVAPFTCGLIPTAVVYAFADVYGGDNQGICETVAQEVSHAFGLDHEFLCEDPMTYLSGCGAKTFQDQAASCGEFEPRECSCGGSSQNSVQQMLQTIGASDGTVVPPSRYGVPGDWPPETVLSVTLEECDGRTAMTVREVGIPEVMREPNIYITCFSCCISNPY